MQRFTAYLDDESRTAAFGAALAAALAPGLVIYLHGDLGAGKTALTRAMLQAAGFIGPVKSPTYTLAEPYAVTVGGQRLDVIHFDLYRMGSPEEFLDAGFRDYFNAGNVCIVEWPEKGAPVLPLPDIDIFLTVNGTGRDIECRALSDQGSRCLHRLIYPPAT